jgi:hypothetical protein
VRPLSALFLSLLASAYGGAANAQLSDNVVRAKNSVLFFIETRKQIGTVFV